MDLVTKTRILIIFKTDITDLTFQFYHYFGVIYHVTHTVINSTNYGSLRTHHVLDETKSCIESMWGVIMIVVQHIEHKDLDFASFRELL